MTKDELVRALVAERFQPSATNPEACKHQAPDIVHNAQGEPVRLICRCGRNWRVVPDELKVIVAGGTL